MAASSGAQALLTPIVLAWNTNRMDDVVARLQRDGVGIEEDWLRRIGPAHFSHINFRGHSGSTSSGTRTCSSNALPVAVRPSQAIEAHGHVPEADRSAMRWSADLQVRLLTGGQRPFVDIRPQGFHALKQSHRLAEKLTERIVVDPFFFRTPQRHWLCLAGHHQFTPLVNACRSIPLRAQIR